MSSNEHLNEEEDVGTTNEIEDPELEAIKQKMKEIEEEAEKLQKLESEVKKNMGAPGAVSIEDKEEIDTRSIYVGNVDYGATPEELQAHFSTCGTINRITILCDSHTGQPKGYAYIEFMDKEAVNHSLALNDSIFRGRQLKVTAKRTNVPGLKAKRFRGAPGARGRGRGAAAAAMMMPLLNPMALYSMMAGAARGARGASRFRNRRAHFSPY
eukprot:Colp12_sorted_trinity150504_noHs@31143